MATHLFNVGPTVVSDLASPVRATPQAHRAVQAAFSNVRRARLARAGFSHRRSMF
jgi:hypothetical protein